MKPRLGPIAVFISATTLLACSGAELLVGWMWYPRSYVVSLSDVDGDGDLDAVVGNGHTDDTGSPNTVWLNDGTGRFTDSGQLLGEEFEHTGAVALGDLDGDGDLDAIFGNEPLSTVWLNNGAGGFSKHGEYQMMPDSMGYMASKAVSLGDVNGDGSLDVFVGNCCRGEYGISGPSTGYIRKGYGDSYNTVWLNDGSGRFTDSGQLLGNESTLAVALGDVDGDGDLDAFVGNKRDSGSVAVGSPANEVWINDGAGCFADSGQLLGRANSYAVALGDLDGDGDLDAFVGNGDPRTSGQADEVWLNDGSGRFTDSGQHLGDANTRVVTLIDVENDGDLDASVDGDTADQIWLNDGAGRFLDSGQRLEHSNRHVVTAGDVDGDGDVDVFAAHYDSGCQVWTNDGTGRFGQKSDWALTPICLAAAGTVVLGLCLLGWRVVRRRRWSRPVQ